MKRVNLQPYSDGNIYRNQDGTYTVETPLGSGSGDNVEQALKDFSNKLNTVTELPKPKHKNKSTKKLDKTD